MGFARLGFEADENNIVAPDENVSILRHRLVTVVLRRIVHNEVHVAVTL